MDTALRRLAPLTGVVFVALYVASSLVAGGGSPEFAAPGDEVAAYYADNETQILVGAVLAAIGAPFFLWFAGCLRTAIARVEGGPTRLASTAFGGGVAALAVGTAGVMIHAMGAFRVREQGEIGAEVATAYFDVGQILAYAAVPAASAAALAATAVAALRYRAILPAWLAWLTLAIALVAVAPPYAWIATLAAVGWVLVVSLLLYQQRVAEEPAPGRAAT